jgi:citrate lyase subunit beta/citryl-CoA lyase
VPRPRRTWLFVPGADAAAHKAAASSQADVLIQELEDFTPPERRPAARAMATRLYDAWRAAGKIAAVRVNPLEDCGREDLAEVLKGRPDVVLMPKVVSPEQVRALAALTGDIPLVPNVETAAGLVNACAIGKASPKVIAMLVASEDMVADLGTSRSRNGDELDYVRRRFLVECRAAGVEAIDCPYTFSDAAGAARDAKFAKSLGYRMKSLVAADHAPGINKVFTASGSDLRNARRIVEAFEKARSGGKERAKVDGKLVEVPIYSAAKRLLSSAVHMPRLKQRTRR